MFKRRGFTEEVRTHRYEHYKHNGNSVIGDVYDGFGYKNLFDKGILSMKNNISFVLNTDGVNIFKSSKLSMWPVYLMINELSITKRKAKENMLVYGSWIGQRKPYMWTYLHPLTEELSQLENGVMFTDHTGSVFVCRAALLSCTCIYQLVVRLPTVSSSMGNLVVGPVYSQV